MAARQQTDEAYVGGPRTLDERLISVDDPDAMMALGFCRRRREVQDAKGDWIAERWSELEPWQRIGPELLWDVPNRSRAHWDRFALECVQQLRSLRWVQRQALSDFQLEVAAQDAVEALFYRECTRADISALRCACRKETFLNLRAECVAFMAACMYEAAFHFEHALHGE